MGSKTYDRDVYDFRGMKKLFRKHIHFNEETNIDEFKMKYYQDVK